LVGFTLLPLLAGVVLLPGLVSCTSLSFLPSARLILAGRLARLLALVRSGLRRGVQIAGIVLRHGGYLVWCDCGGGASLTLRMKCEGQVIQTSTYVLNGVDPLQSVLCV
jgi:hypothetical protein